MAPTRLLVLGLVTLTLGACTGPVGKDGIDGEQGQQGASGCTAPTGQSGIGLQTTITVSAPANGQYFTPGETLQMIIKFADRCQRAVDVADLDVANFYITGPRSGLKTKTAAKLLNCIVDRNAPDDQHHFIDLQDPHFSDPEQDNFGRTENGSIIFTTGPVSDEAPGTYTVGVWARSTDEEDQVFTSTSFQIGTADKEQYAAGPPGAFPACGRCHWGPETNKIYLAHTRPVAATAAGTAAPERMKGMPASYVNGNWALDFTPIETCQHCHNQDSYSAFPLVAKVHAIHRGKDLKLPGQAHPYMTQVAGGLQFDSSIAQYADVDYPSMPDGVRDCTQCHVDDRYLSSPSPLACVGCHETLDLSAGTITPPRVYGWPGRTGCTDDQACIDGFSKSAVCNTTTGACENRAHPTLADKPNCAECHTADSSGSSPIPTKHAVKLRTLSEGIKITDFKLTGGTGPNGAFLVGDTLSLKFNFVNRDGAPLDLLAKDKNGLDLYRIDFVVGGPTDDRQRLAGGGAPASRATLAADPSGGFQYVIDNKDKTGKVLGLPAVALAPSGLPFGTPGRANPPGTYSVHFYVAYSPGYGVYGGAVYEAASGSADFRFCPSAGNCPSDVLRPRQVIAAAGCTGCHVTVTAHGGMRTDPEACSLCHTAGAIDYGAGSKGAVCTKDTDCPGHNADATKSWEECQDTNADGTVDTCVVVAKNRKGKSCKQSSDCFGYNADATKCWEVCADLLGADGKPGTDGVLDTCQATTDRDPTGPRTIEMTNMTHSIHYARLRGGYLEKDQLVPGLVFLGYGNGLTDLSDRLFSLDMRNCTKCHVDSGEQCVEDNDTCGIGQACRKSKCINVSWRAATNGSPCLACHDTEAGWAHIQLNTYQPPDGSLPIESCGACHAEDRAFSPEKVHQIASPYVPPYPRELASH